MTENVNAVDNMINHLNTLIKATVEGKDIAKVEVAEDRQGNPINANGSLILEEVSTIDDITDGDFIEPSRNVMLPALPSN